MRNVPLFDAKPYTVEEPPTQPRCKWCGKFLAASELQVTGEGRDPLCDTCQRTKDDNERPRGAVPGEYRPLEPKYRQAGKRGVQAARAALRKGRT